MQITHQYLKKYSYLRSNPKNIPPPAPEQNEKSIKNEENEIAIVVSEQNEKLETEIQQPIHQDIELYAQNEQGEQEELSQSLKKTVKTTPTRRNLIFEPLISNNPPHNPPIQKERNLMIVQQYNLLFDLHSQPKEEIKEIQENIQLQSSKKDETLKSVENQQVSQQVFNPFDQQKEISMYVDEIQIEQQEQVLNSQPNQEEEQKFLKNESIDYDYNKEDYLKVIQDYIEFIKMVEYIDKDQIEQQILKHQHITSRKKYFLIVEPLIQLMLFEQFPQNPFKKDTQTIHSTVDYVAFYELLKDYKSQLAEKDYIPNLSHFMHYQLSQQTVYFLKVKKEQIRWNQVLFQELQKSRNDLSIILKIYEQLQQTPLYLLDSDIEAFLIQISSISELNIKIFQLLFSKYKKKIHQKLKEMKWTNMNHSKKQNFAEYDEAKDILQIKLQDLRDNITINLQDTQNNMVFISPLLKQFSQIQKLIVQVQHQEVQFKKLGITYDPIEIPLNEVVTQIFSPLQIDGKGPAQKAKVLLRSRIGEFSWSHALQQEQKELKNMILRYKRIVEYYDEIRNQYSEELSFVRTLKIGKQIFQQNLLLLTQYLFIKQELNHTEISIVSYPLTDFQCITVVSTSYENLIKETNNKVIAIQQLKQYKILESLTKILAGEDYQQVYKQLFNLKNTLSVVKFSPTISEQINMVIQYIKTALNFFPKDIFQIYSQTETYQELEEHLGDMKQFKKDLQFLFDLFESFFLKKVQNEFNWIFEHLINLSNQECNFSDLQYLQTRLDILYDFNRADMNNKYINKELIEKIQDQPNVRDLINLGRGFLEDLTVLVLEDNLESDISYSNQKIINKILEVECPQNVNTQLQDFSPLLFYHKSLQLYPNEQQFHNSQFNLGLLVCEEYQKYLTACQQRIRQLFQCTFIKVNTLKIEELDNVLFKIPMTTDFIPIGQLHKYIQCFYDDVQSIIIPQQSLQITINGKKVKKEGKLDVQIQYKNQTNIGVYIDDMILFICE